MPGLVRKLLIFAAIDGLILQPATQKGQRPAPATKITYKDKHIGPVLNDSDVEESTKGFEAFGIVGMHLRHGRRVYISNNMISRPLDGFQKLLLNIDYEKRTSGANTRKANICYY